MEEEALPNKRKLQNTNASKVNLKRNQPSEPTEAEIKWDAKIELIEGLKKKIPAEQRFKERWFNFRLDFMNSLKKHSVHDVRTFIEMSIDQQGIRRPEKIRFVPFNEAYNGLLDTMNNTFEAEINTYTLLLGNPGMGKTSAVYYAFLNCKYNQQAYLEKINQEFRVSERNNWIKKRI